MTKAVDRWKSAFHCMGLGHLAALFILLRQQFFRKEHFSVSCCARMPLPSLSLFILSIKKAKQKDQIFSMYRKKKTKLVTLNLYIQVYIQVWQPGTERKAF